MNSSDKPRLLFLHSEYDFDNLEAIMPAEMCRRPVWDKNFIAVIEHSIYEKMQALYLQLCDGHEHVVHKMYEEKQKLQSQLNIALEALKEIRNERKSFGACPSFAKRALEKIGGGDD